MKKVNADQISSGDLFGTREVLKDNYLYRYVGAKLGLYGNSKQDAIYFGYFVDGSHQPLDASKTSYELHFAQGGLPPNKAFWSLTMYDGKTQLLVANPLKRYLLNSTTLSPTNMALMVRSPSIFRGTHPARIRKQLATRARWSVLCRLPRLYAGRNRHQQYLEEAADARCRNEVRPEAVRKGF